VTGSKLPG